MMDMLPTLPFFLFDSIFPSSISVSLLQEKIKENWQTWQELVTPTGTSQPIQSKDEGLLKIASPTTSQSSEYIDIEEDFDDQLLNGRISQTGIYAHILAEPPIKKLTYSPCSPTRNRYGRVYVSGRPLVMKDRLRIVELHKKGYKKINIAKELGVTHSCVSKVLRRYLETGSIEARNVKSNQQRKLKRELPNDLGLEAEPKRKMISFTISKSEF